MKRTGRLVAGLVGVALGAAAQTPVTWQTMDGGGGTSTGGVFAVAGTIGQPDGTAAMRGGGGDVQGGFWALIELMQTLGAPTLRIASMTTDKVTLAWPVAGAADFQLQQASHLIEPDWTTVAGAPTLVGADYQLTTGPLAVKHYYRLQKP